MILPVPFPQRFLGPKRIFLILENTLYRFVLIRRTAFNQATKLAHRSWVSFRQQQPMAQCLTMAQIL